MNMNFKKALVNPLKVMHILFLLIIAKSVITTTVSVIQSKLEVLPPLTSSVKTQALPTKRITRPKYANEPSAEPTAYVPPSITTFSNSFVPAFIPTNYFSNKIPQVNTLKSLAAVNIGVPTRAPTKVPITTKPSKFPTGLPLISPTTPPSLLQTIVPSTSPSISSTVEPSSSPWFWPTVSPSAKSTSSKKPSRLPTIVPTTSSPSSSPSSSSPTNAPSTGTTNSPSQLPTITSTTRGAPTKTSAPTSTSPSLLPTITSTTRGPSVAPTKSSAPTSTSPSLLPTSSSTTRGPSVAPTKSSAPTSTSPSRLPSSTTSIPPSSPSKSGLMSSTSPSLSPTKSSTTSSIPSPLPSKSIAPTSRSPSLIPTKSFISPTIAPSTTTPSLSPSKSTASPSASPTTRAPTSKPSSLLPSNIPPTRSPSKSFRPTPIKKSVQAPPSWQPSMEPSFVSHDNDVTYHNNGSIILSPKIYNIYVGSFSSTTMDLIDYLAANLNQGTPSWYSVVKSYSQVVDGKVSNPGAPAFIERWTFNPSVTTVSDDFFQNLIGPRIASKGLLNCTQCIFAIIFNGGFQMPGWNGQSGYAPFCGYHLVYEYYDNQGVSYAANIAVVGDPTTTSPIPYLSCMSHTYGVTANKDPSGDSIATTYMHEIAEVITDFDGNTWYSDNTGYEIADECNFKFGDSFDYTTANYNYQFGMKKFLVQTLSQPRLGCVAEFKLHAGPNQYTFKPVTAPTRSPSLPNDVSFHEPGGVVVDPTQQSGVTLYNVYLGSIAVSTKQLTDYFGSHISTTTWYQTLTSYFDYLGPKGWVNFNTRFTMGKATAIQPTGQALQLTEPDIQNYLLPLYNSNTSTAFDVYAVMFRGDFNISIGGKYWLRDWCSYHGSFLILPQNYVFRYFLVGDPSTTAPGQSGQACAPISGTGRVTANGDLGGDSIAVGYAQQLAQTLTNSKHYTWYSDTDGAEVSSACLGLFGPGFNLAQNNSNIVVGNKKFLVQEIWQRGVGCTMHI